MIGMITPAEFEDEMKAYLETIKSASVVTSSEDKEAREAHENANELLLKVLRSFGYEKGLEVYKQVNEAYESFLSDWRNNNGRHTSGNDV